jgi:predicted HTH transcriptional regulator
VEPREAYERQAREAIDFASEVTGVEFKRSEPFDILQYKIAKTAQALANLRDGGLIIVGVSQTNKVFSIDGVDAAVEATYNGEAIYEHINWYASPPIDSRTIVLEHLGKRFVVMVIAPFERTPVVCRHPTPDGTPKKDAMKPGDFFVRTAEKIETKRVDSAQLMEDLLQLAAGRRAAEIIRILRTGGVAPEAMTPGDRFEKEVEDFGDFL